MQPNRRRRPFGRPPAPVVPRDRRSFEPSSFRVGHFSGDLRFASTPPLRGGGKPCGCRRRQAAGRTTVATSAPLPPLFDEIERALSISSVTTNADNGLAPDRHPSRPFSSIAAIGFALTAYPIGVERTWITRAQATERTLTTLKFLRDAPAGPEATGKAGHRGFYYHFLDMRSGQRFAEWVELSSVDTGLMMMGILFAQSYYDRDDAAEREIRGIAD